MTVPGRTDPTAYRADSADRRRLLGPLAGPLLAVCGLAVCLGAADDVWAQAAAEAEAESVERRPRLDFESYGLSLDSVYRNARATGAPPVYAFTKLEVEGGHDSNVRRAASGPTSSLFTVTRPGVSLRWDGETHQSALTAQAAIGRYGSSGGDDYEDLELGAETRVEVAEDTALRLSGNVGRFHVPRGSDLDLGPGFGAQTYQSYTVALQGESTALPDNPMSATLRSTWYRFDDVDGVDRGALDRWITAGNLRFAFARAGDVSFFVQPGVQRVDYTENAAGNPDSTRLDLAVGATYSGGPISQVSGFLGGSRRSFDQGGTGAEFSALAGMNLLWNATPLMTLGGDMSLANEDSVLSAASSVLTTTLGLRLDYEVLDNLILGGDIRWTDYRYDGGVADERLLETGLAAHYMLNEYAYVGAGLRYENNTSSDPASDYKATVATLRLGLKLCCLRDIDVDGPDGRRLRQGVVNGVFR